MGTVLGLVFHPSCGAYLPAVFIKDDLLLLLQWSMSLEINMKNLLEDSEAVLVWSNERKTGSCPGLPASGAGCRWECFCSLTPGPPE